MQSSHLKPWQARRLLAAVKPSAAFLHRLKQRMIDRQFPAQDKLFQTVCRAHSVMHELLSEIQFIAAQGGGRQHR